MDRFFFNSIIFLLINLSLGECANILGVFPSPGYSQYILAEPLLVALGGKGHNVTVISGFKTDGVKNVHNIVIDLSFEEELDLFKLQELSIFANMDLLNEMGLILTEKILSNPDVQALINSEHTTFNLVIIETFFADALQAFAKHFNAHQVLFSSIAISEWNSHLVGNPNIPSYLPTSFAGYTTNMNFYERFRNTMALWYNEYYKLFHKFPSHQKLVNTYFPKNYSLLDIIYNASLILTCSHVSTSESNPLTTGVVEVGGLHIKPNNRLPQSMETFLNSAENGAIFFSMGTNLRSASMSDELIEAILNVIKGLQQKVLWKFENEDLKNKPDNLMISKWFPQSDILAHPNTVAFISHGGMGSTTEAIYNGVPVIGIPMFGDQFMNVRKLVQFGMAIELPFKELSGQRLNESLREILDNSKYKQMAKKRSQIFKDRPISPLDEAIYWIEYVLRHDGAHHLKTSIVGLPWYKLYLVDILLVILFLIISTCYIIYKFFIWSTKRLQRPKIKTL